MSKKVEEQKGPIRDNMPTYRDMTYMERQIERHMQLVVVSFELVVMGQLACFSHTCYLQLPL